MADETTPVATPAPEPVEPNLEQLRDEKCIPVARGILVDMATDIIPEDANKEVNYLPFIMKTLKRTLDADTNLTIDNPYIFQMIKGVLIALNVTVQRLTPSTSIDDVRFGRIARQILTIVAQADINLTPKTPDEVEASFVPIKSKLQELFDAEKMSWMEIKYVMDNIFEAHESTTDLFNRKIESFLEKAEAKAMGVEFMSDITMQKLDMFLKADLTALPATVAEGSAPPAEETAA